MKEPWFFNKMEIKILKKDKNEMQIEIDNLTIAELLRNELWNDSSLENAAWKRDHPTKNPVLILKTKGKNPKTVLSSTISSIIKKNDKLASDFKKLK